MVRKSVLRRNILGLKLHRDMLHAFMQFLSIIALCALGTFAFSALDGTARMTRETIDKYFSENALADLFITLPSADRTALTKVRNIEGIGDAIARGSMDFDTTLGDDVRVNVMAFDGEMTINRPLLRTGALLDTSDRRGCLIEERFAERQGLGVGDRLTLKFNGSYLTFVIRGVVVSPEFIVVSNSVSMHPDRYGYILVNSRSVPFLPLTQIVVKFTGSDVRSDDVQAAVESALPAALVINRDAHTSTARIQNDAQMFENMTYIFPLLAYFIAALIVMTTLQRMIDNQRLQIGTLKALGFSARKIRHHYLQYAILPSFIGGLIGTLLGHYILPNVLWNALMSQNEMPYQLHPPVSLQEWGMVLLTVLMSAGICLRTYRKSAMETTASLLRPKAPKGGRRILLERIPALWSRFGFNAKMITRNIFRNKMRAFMFFLGILFCNMLIITSFGLQDSVKILTSDYYLHSLRYDASASLNSLAGTADAYDRRLDAERVECVMTRGISLRTEAGTRTVQFTVLEDDQELQNLGFGTTYLPLSRGDIAVTYKLSRVLRIAPGDTVEVWFPGDDRPLHLTVSHLCENNFSQGIYLTSSTWESFHRGAFVPTDIHLKNPTPACLEQLADMEEVETIDFPAEQINEMLDLLSTLNSVFALLTGIALALAFVICYSMGLMNFVERIREYATLKVLGYHQKEIRNLILAENIVLTLLGIFLGIYPGILLTDAVMHACEPETAFYSGTPTILTIFLAGIITFVFSVFLQLILTRKVKRIDMVEALKSVE